METAPRAVLGRNVRYGAAAFALGMPTIPLLVHLPAIYAEEIGLGLTTTAVALFAARIIDVITDPIIGIASDRMETPWGRRKPLILLGGLIGAIGTVFLLNPGFMANAGGGGRPGPLYLAFWASMLYLGWTLINIPYLAWGAELSEDYRGRSTITSVRESFMLAGIVIAGAVPAIAASFGYGEREALSIVGWIVVGLGAVLFAVLLKTVQESGPPPLHSPENLSVALRGITNNGPFLRLVVGWFINSLANGIPAVLFILFMKHVLEADELKRGLLTFAYFVAGVVGMPGWLWLSARIGKHRTWVLAMGLASVAFAVVPWLGAGDVSAFLIVVLITGICLGADLALPPSMQADVAEFEYFRSRRDRTALMFAFWSMTTKVALALSVLLAFPALDFVGFKLNEDNSVESLLALSMIYAGVPVVLKIISMIVIWPHPLTPSRQSLVRRRLSALETRQERNA